MQNYYVSATLSKRFFANLFDAIILFIIFVLSALIFVVIYSLIMRTDEIPEYLLSGLNFVITWLYYTFMKSSPQQATIGKQSMGIFVTDLNGNRLSFKKASSRSCSKILFSIVLGISFIPMFFTEKKQALHDITSRTLVVQKVKN
jgi:uncharacterized RDD family membrane protein YckC